MCNAVTSRRDVKSSTSRGKEKAPSSKDTPPRKDNKKRRKSAGQTEQEKNRARKRKAQELLGLVVKQVMHEENNARAEREQSTPCKRASNITSSTSGSIGSHCSISSSTSTASPHVDFYGTPKATHAATPPLGAISSPSQLFAVGQLVMVQSRMMPGHNKPGGVGRITTVNKNGTGTTADADASANASATVPANVYTYSVKYVLGGGETNLASKFVSPHTTDDGNDEESPGSAGSRTSRKRTRVSPLNFSEYKQQNEIEQYDSDDKGKGKGNGKDGVVKLNAAAMKRCLQQFVERCAQRKAQKKGSLLQAMTVREAQRCVESVLGCDIGKEHVASIRLALGGSSGSSRSNGMGGGSNGRNPGSSGRSRSRSRGRGNGSGSGSGRGKSVNRNMNMDTEDKENEEEQEEEEVRAHWQEDEDDEEEEYEDEHNTICEECELVSHESQYRK